METAFKTHEESERRGEERVSARVNTSIKDSTDRSGITLKHGMKGKGKEVSVRDSDPQSVEEEERVSESGLGNRGERESARGSTR